MLPLCRISFSFCENEEDSHWNNADDLVYHTWTRESIQIIEKHTDSRGDEQDFCAHLIVLPIRYCCNDRRTGGQKTDRPLPGERCRWRKQQYEQDKPPHALCPFFILVVIDCFTEKSHNVGKRARETSDKQKVGRPQNVGHQLQKYHSPAAALLVDEKGYQHGRHAEKLSYRIHYVSASYSFSSFMVGWVPLGRAVSASPRAA